MSFRIVKDVDNGFTAFFKDLRTANQLRVRVGAVGVRAQQRHPGSTLNNAELLAVHEFGAPSVNIPQRAPLRTTADANRRKYERGLEAISKKIVKRPKQANVFAELTVLGERVRADVIKAIKAGLPPPLSEPYRTRKVNDGFPSTPLIRTGQLIGSIDVEVKKV